MVGFWIKGAQGVIKGVRAGAKLKEGPKFTKDTLKHMKKYDKRIKKMKKHGYEGPTYDFSGKKDKTGSHLLKEVWTKDPYK